MGTAKSDGAPARKPPLAGTLNTLPETFLPQFSWSRAQRQNFRLDAQFSGLAIDNLPRKSWQTSDYVRTVLRQQHRLSLSPCHIVRRHPKLPLDHELLHHSKEKTSLAKAAWRRKRTFHLQANRILLSVRTQANTHAMTNMQTYASRSDSFLGRHDHVDNSGS